MSHFALSRRTSQVTAWNWADIWPPLALVATGVAACVSLPPWLFMWSLAVAVYIAFKWLMWRLTAWEGEPVSTGRFIGWLFWPGMDPRQFLVPRQRTQPLPRSAWLFACGKVALGVMLIWIVARLALPLGELVAGWVALVGLALVIHFGVFDLLSWLWRAAGYSAAWIMDWPIAATSVADFWGHRWNLAFRQLADRLTYRPLIPRIGPRFALLFSFLFSGVIHDLVISVPADGGYGLPTSYFLIQVVGILIERSALGRRLRLRSGARGWLFTALIVVAPAGLLFHPPFIGRIVAPMLVSIGAV